MGNSNKILVVVPTFNEANNIPRLAEAVFSLPIEGIQLLIVDDNSPDGTGQIADRLADEYPGCVNVLHRLGKKGLGTAYIEGFQMATSTGEDTGISAQLEKFRFCSRFALYPRGKAR